MLSVHLCIVLLGTMFGVLQGDLGTSSPAAGTCLCFTGNAVNIRSAAGVSGSIIGKGNAGECYKYAGGKITRDGYTWYSISYNGKTGWTAGSFLIVGSSTSCSSTGPCGVGGAFDNVCLACMCEEESRCQPLNCKMDKGSLSCGYYQIKSDYYTDCYKPGSGWESCSKDKTCATNCVKTYMNRYYKGCTGSTTQCCEQAARIHNGGPDGCKYASTNNYWNKIKACVLRKRQ